MTRLRSTTAIVKLFSQEEFISIRFALQCVGQMASPLDSLAYFRSIEDNEEEREYARQFIEAISYAIEHMPNHSRLPNHKFIDIARSRSHA